MHFRTLHLMTALLLICTGCPVNESTPDSDASVDASDGGATATSDATTGTDAATRDAESDADTRLSPAARGPCSTAADCMLSDQCPCPEPMLEGENPEACHSRVPRNSALACRDTFGGEQVTDPLRLVCHEKICHTFAGRFCDVFEDSPNAGVGVLKDPFFVGCASDVNCEIATRLNPCGCEEAISNIGGSENAPADWTEEVMATVWDAAERQCAEQGECDCPPAPSGVTCNVDEGRCELVP